MQPTTYVINMPQNESRWRHIQQQLSDLSMQGTHFNAVVGSALTPDEIDAIYDSKLNKHYHHRNLTVGEIGCYASHRQVWQALLDSGDPYAVVLEDDINITNDFIAVLSGVQRLQNWDLIKLSDNRSNPAATSLSLTDTLTCISYHKVPNCTTGYVISRAGAQKLLSRKRFYRPVDIDMQFHSELGLQVIGILPYCVFEADFESEIASMNLNKRHGNKSTFWRNAKHRLAMMLERKKVSANIALITKSNHTD